MNRKRILHLVDRRGGAARPAVFALMARVIQGLDGHTHRTLLVGPPHLRDEAVGAGLGADEVDEPDTVSPPFGRLIPSIPGVGRKLDRIGEVDICHCWSVRCALWAQLLRPRTPRVVHLTRVPSFDELAMLRRLSASDAKRPMSSSSIVALFRQIADVVRRESIPDDRIHTVGPIVEMNGQPDREAIRARWGISPGDESPTAVVALLGDPAHVGDTVEGLMTLGLVQRCIEDAPGATSANTPRLRLLLHPAQHRRVLGIEQAQANHWYDSMIQDDAVKRPWEVLAGCDIALDAGGYGQLAVSTSPHVHGGFDVNGHRIAPAIETGGLSTAWALAAGVPLVSPRNSLTEPLTHGRHALLSEDPAPKSLAPFVLELVRNVERRTEIGNEAVAYARDHFAAEHVIPIIDRLYQGDL